MDRQKDGLTDIQTWSRHAKSIEGERQKKRESERQIERGRKRDRHTCRKIKKKGKKRIEERKRVIHNIDLLKGKD